MEGIRVFPVKLFPHLVLPIIGDSTFELMFVICLAWKTWQWIQYLFFVSSLPKTCSSLDVTIALNAPDPFFRTKTSKKAGEINHCINEHQVQSRSVCWKSYKLPEMFVGSNSDNRKPHQSRHIFWRAVNQRLQGCTLSKKCRSHLSQMPFTSHS